jgi:hypothetical protein
MLVCLPDFWTWLQCRGRVHQLYLQKSYHILRCLKSTVRIIFSLLCEQSHVYQCLQFTGSDRVRKFHRNGSR